MKYPQRQFCTYVATLASLGIYTYAPGTCATAVTLVFISSLSFFSLSLCSYLGIVGIMSIAALVTIYYALPCFHERDPSAIVIDEVVGTLVTFAGLTPSWSTLCLGFILFRFFDIVKPLGIKQIEKKGPPVIGIVADDVVAGLYANLLLQLFTRFFV